MIKITFFVFVFIYGLASEDPTAPTPIPYRIGYIAKDHPSDGQTINGWLGRPLDVLGTTITLSAYWIPSFPSSVHVSAAVPMLTIPGWDPYNVFDMGKAASGGYDTYYRSMATALVKGPAKVLSVRFGWEMNGNWYPWSAGGPGGVNNNHSNYIDTFRRMTNIFRSIIPGVKIEFCTNYAFNPTFSNASGTPLDYWPGNEYVDIISMDFYQSNNGGEWSNTQSKGTYNLDWLVSFAKSHGCKVGLSEWGAAHDDGSFISDGAKWMNSLGDLFVYHMYSQYAPADQVVNPGENPVEQAAWISAWRNTYYSGP
jgi:beta-mannanase